MKKINTVDIKNKVKLKFQTIDSLMKKNKHQKIDILKMDIEGSEYEVLEDILSKKIPIKQILVEFHPYLFKDGREKTKYILDILTENNYRCFAVSQNMLEYSFIKYKWKV